MDDERFSHIAIDPKFQRKPKSVRNVKIDERFQCRLQDTQFKITQAVDKRGRPINHKYTGTGYVNESDQVSSDVTESDNCDKGQRPRKVKTDSSNNANNKQQIPKNIRKRLHDLKVDYARGEASLLSDSSSDDEGSEEELLENDAELDHCWGEFDRDAETTEEATSRLAVCHLDWDRIRAIDLMVLFNSFLPQNAIIKSVAIYPSDFGKTRLREEEVNGPPEFGEMVNEEEGTEDGVKFNMEKLRQYQLNRLKYFYAIATFDSANTANKIYTECDGMEYESSATKVDLRFVPEDMVFDDEPKEICQNLPDFDKYEPRFFVTTALQQAKVDLTWDETDPRRQELIKKCQEGKLNDADIQELIASGSSDESEIEESEINRKSEAYINRFRTLLQEIEKKEADEENEVDMEITWDVDLKDKTEKVVQKKMLEGEFLTPFEKYVEKRKEKKKEKKRMKKAETSENDLNLSLDVDIDEQFDKTEFRKKKSKKTGKESTGEDNAELDLLVTNEDGNKHHFNLKKIQDSENAALKKKKKKQNPVVVTTEDDFQINVNDDRFSALFTSHLYNIDPTDPNFKKTKTMQLLMEEKRKRQDSDEHRAKKRKVEKKDAALNVLMKSVKRKAALIEDQKKKF